MIAVILVVITSVLVWLLIQRPDGGKPLRGWATLVLAVFWGLVIFLGAVI